MPTYIDKNKLMNEFIEFVAPSNLDYSIPIPTWNDAVSLLGSAPDADVVEVVRCKDCKHFAEFGSLLKIYTEYDGQCKKANRDVVMNFTDFCSYGERREENAEI